MKQFVWVAASILVLGGVATVLLRTDQAPLGDEGALSSQAPAQEPAPAAPAEPVNAALTTEEFRALGAEVMRALPTKESLKGLQAGEAHGQPAPIVAAGRELGAIAEALEKDPSLGEEAFLLYESCASSSQYPDSVRALCYFHYRSLGQKLGKQVSRKMVPLSVRQLADRLSD